MNPTERLLAEYRTQIDTLINQLSAERAENESMRTLLRHAGEREGKYITTIREQIDLIRLLEQGERHVAA